MFRILAILAFFLPGLVQAQTQDHWRFDRSHSSVTFMVDHYVVSELQGKFRNYSVTTGGSRDDLADLTIQATIAAASIDTEDPKRDEHLRSGDFFDTGAHPNITFVSSSVQRTGANAYDIRGMLTIRGVTRPVVLKATSRGSVRTPNGHTVLALRAETTIKRKDFGVSWSKTMDNGGVVVGDEVRVTILAELMK